MNKSTSRPILFRDLLDKEECVRKQILFSEMFGNCPPNYADPDKLSEDEKADLDTFSTVSSEEASMEFDQELLDSMKDDEKFEDEDNPSKIQSGSESSEALGYSFR